MNYASVCSGIEAPTVAWESLGWSAAWYSEIEPFPCAVLQHHYPETPNLGDMTKFKEWKIDTDIDVLVGGTPCQSFSVAGLRKGLADPRGNLTLTFLSIVEKKKPRWVVYENVPGIISDKTEALKSLLDGLEELGYIIDIDILDAQFFGVPQRRRRVFICAQSITDLLMQKTDTSAITIAQCWQEILHGILISQSQEYAREPGNSDFAYLSKDGVTRRMNLFGFLGEKKNYEKLREHLIESYRRCQAGQKNSDVPLGGKEKGLIQDAPLTGLAGVKQFILTEQSLKIVLDESYQVMKSFITLTGTNTITPEQIYMCSLAVLYIARLIQLLNPLSPSLWSGVSSSSIALKEYMNYARQANNDLFAGMEWVQKRCDFLRQAESTDLALSNLRTRNFEREILLVAHSLSGDTPPSRKKGERVAPTVTGGPPFSRTGNERVEAEAMVAVETGPGWWNSDNKTGPLRAEGENRPSRPSHIVMAHGQGNAEIRMDGSPSLTCNHEAPIVAFNYDQSEHTRSMGESIDQTPTLRAGGGIAITQEQAVQVQWASGGGKVENPTAQALRAGAEHNYQFLRSGFAVRRLTPRTCERLQGFQDDYTLVPYRGKPAADGPRYKALGNSMAVPVIRWIGERIEAAERVLCP